MMSDLIKHLKTPGKEVALCGSVKINICTPRETVCGSMGLQEFKNCSGKI